MKARGRFFFVVVSIAFPTMSHVLKIVSVVLLLGAVGCSAQKVALILKLVDECVTESCFEGLRESLRIEGCDDIRIFENIKMVSAKCIGDTADAKGEELTKNLPQVESSSEDVAVSVATEQVPMAPVSTVELVPMQEPNMTGGSAASSDSSMTLATISPSTSTGINVTFSMTPPAGVAKPATTALTPAGEMPSVSPDADDMPTKSDEPIEFPNGLTVSPNIFGVPGGPPFIDAGEETAAVAASPETTTPPGRTAALASDAGTTMLSSATTIMPSSETNTISPSTTNGMASSTM